MPTIQIPEQQWRSGKAYAAHAELSAAVCSRDISLAQGCLAHFPYRAEMRAAARRAVRLGRESKVPLSIVWRAWRATYALRRACYGKAAA